MGLVDAARLLTACGLEAASSLLRVAAERLDPDGERERQRRKRKLDTLARMSQELGLYDETYSESV